MKENMNYTNSGNSVNKTDFRIHLLNLLENGIITVKIDEITEILLKKAYMKGTGIMENTYQTTHITPARSYPTYQFHAHTVSSEPASDVFLICILESLRWLRNRLSDFNELPEELVTPEPEDYHSFCESRLSSFSLDLGCSIESVYLENEGIWTLTVSENDMGANIGSEQERKPVQGRRFITDISFRKYPEHVEAGVRTICYEPVDTDAGCEVFRPTLVKKLSENPLVCFRNQYNIDGSPVIISSRSEAETFCDAVFSKECDMPFVIVCEPEKVKTVKKAAEVFESAKTVSVSAVSAVPAGGLSGNFTVKTDFASDFSLTMVKKNDEKKSRDDGRKFISLDVPKPKQNIKKADLKEQYEYTDQKTIDYAALADSLKGFGIVVYLPEKCINTVNNKTGLGFEAGDAIVMMHGIVSETVKFDDFKNDPDVLRKRLKKEVRMMLRGAAFSYGTIVFGTDARILGMSRKEQENMTLEERISLLENQKNALEQKIRELQNNDNGMRMNAEELRNTSKKLEAEIREREKAEAAAKKAVEKLEKISDSYRKSSSVISFYKKKAEDAGHFPDNAEDVCSWAEKTLSEGIVITSRARNELKKYSGALDVADLCDGLYYLNAYAAYRLGNISEDELNLYAESCSWEVTGCGKGALRTCADDYTVTHDGIKYTLDLHIKNGVSSQLLIRIYFCWSDETGKVIIGSMPGHLGTSKQST